MRFVIATLAATLAIAAPAAAQSAGETVTVRIALADIDLSSDEGRAALEQRIEAQIAKACTIESNSRYAFGRDLVDQACLAEARSQALAAAERIAARNQRSGGGVAAN